MKVSAVLCAMPRLLMTLAGVIAACGSDYKGRLMKVSAVLCAMSRLLMTLAGVIAACGSDY